MFIQSSTRVVVLGALVAGAMANAAAEPPRHNNVQRAGAPVAATAANAQNPVSGQRGNDTSTRGDGGNNNGAWLITPRPSFAGGGYDVSNGEVTVHMPDEKSARKAARALKRAQKKEDDSNESGVRDTGDGNCGGQVLC